MSLKSLQFSDIYLGVDSALISGVPNTLDPIPVPTAQHKEAAELRQVCVEFQMKNPNCKDFPISYEGVSYRASIMVTISEIVFVLRRLSEKVKLINELGIPPVLVESMMTPGMTGLFVLSGSFNQGKTTTASALVVSRIAKFGGVAVTVEDPPEMPMHGHHGDGVCYQTWVNQGGFAEASRQVARWAPSIIFLGEIRDPETAIEALRASINGKLVVCTTHADNPVMAIERIFALGQASGTSADDTLGMLASGLLAVVHQKLKNMGDRRQLTIESLFVSGEEETAVRNGIRQRKFESIKSVISMQKNRMLVSNKKVH